MTAQTKIEAATPHVYQAIASVMKDMATEGIAKTNKNTQQGYKFRGIDDVYNALAPILAKHQLCMLPRVLAREVVERQTKSGGALFYTTVDAEFDLVSAVDGSTHTIRTVGEAMDSADKSSNKAMSAAYKYAAMQAFCIPTEGDNDADAHTHEVAATRAASSDRINDSQVGILQGYASGGVIDAGRFCSFFQISNLKDLPASRYEEALAMAQAKQEKAFSTVATREPSPKRSRPCGRVSTIGRGAL
jgi:hypothetical protein